MSQKSYLSVTGTIFFLIAIMHLVRVFKEWEVVFAGNTVPMWASWAGFLIAGYLAYQGLKRRQ